MRGLVCLVTFPLIFDVAFAFLLSLGGETPTSVPADAAGMRSHAVFDDWDAAVSRPAGARHIGQSGHARHLGATGVTPDGVASERLVTGEISLLTP